MSISPIREGQFRNSWQQDVQFVHLDLSVQVVVRYIHAAPGLLVVQSRWAVHVAREVAVHGREWSFPQLGELVEDIWDGGLVGTVIEEDNGAFAWLYGCKPSTGFSGANHHQGELRIMVEHT
jgi:hypothetical protein